MNKDINHLILFCDEMIARDVYTKEFQDIKDILKDYDVINKLKNIIDGKWLRNELSIKYIK